MSSDLTLDLGQRRDLAPTNPDVVAELRELLSRLRRQGHSAPRYEDR